MKHNLKVGQVVWCASMSPGKEIKPSNLTRAVITLINRKCFTIQAEHFNASISIETLTENKDFAYKKRVFLSVLDCEELYDREQYRSKVLSKNNQQLNKLSTEDLKTIHEILSKYEEQD